MAVLTNQVRDEITQKLMRRGGWSGPITKANVRAMVDALDDWWEINQTSANNAIPATPRAQATAKDKALALMHILNARFEVL